MVEHRRDPSDRRHAVVLTEAGETAAGASPPCSPRSRTASWPTRDYERRLLVDPLETVTARGAADPGRFAARRRRVPRDHG